MPRKYSKYSDEEIIEAIKATGSFTAASELLDINRKTVIRVAHQHDMESKNIRRLADPSQILNKERKTRTPHIMRYVKKNNLLPYLCVKCKCDGSWQGEELVLELDHIDGDCLNNKLDNLRWLCPNCHSQTNTYKNRKRVEDD